MPPFKYKYEIGEHVMTKLRPLNFNDEEYVSGIIESRKYLRTFCTAVYGVRHKKYGVLERIEDNLLPRLDPTYTWKGLIDVC